MEQIYNKIEPLPEGINKLTESILSAAYIVHSSTGPGLLESAYEACLIYELREQGHIVEKQVSVPLIYKGVKLDTGLRIDLLVDNAVVLEIKAVEEILPVHQAQLLTYLKLTGHRVGLLMNFNTCHLKDGIKRMAL